MTEAQRLEPLSLVSRRAEEGRRSVAKLGVAIKVAAVYRARQLREGRAAGGLWRHREVWEGNERSEKSRAVTPQELPESAASCVASPFTKRACLACVRRYASVTCCLPNFVTQMNEKRPDHRRRK